MSKQKKQLEVPVQPEVPAVDPAVAEKENLLSEQSALLSLRAELVKRGINDLSKLDAVLGGVNQRLKELN